MQKQYGTDAAEFCNPGPIMTRLILDAKPATNRLSTSTAINARIEKKTAC
jgi:hypothetical protein